MAYALQILGYMDMSVCKLKNLINFFIFYCLFICFSSQADLVGIYHPKLNDYITLEISLSDTTKAEVEKGLSVCEEKGMYRVFINAIGGQYPISGAYANGCWYVENQRVFIDAKMVRDQSPLSLDFPSSSFTTTKIFKDWFSFEKYPPVTMEQAKEHHAREATQAAIAQSNKEYKELVGFIEHTIQCDYAPFPSVAIEKLQKQKYLEQVSPGRMAVYKVTNAKDLMVFGKKLLFVSGGGSDGSTEDFMAKPKSGISYIPTHFAITVESMPDEESLKARRDGMPPYKSNLQFVSQGSLDGVGTGVTITCGYRVQ